jgi:phage host-nuclease inhibitor protein Gam
MNIDIDTTQAAPAITIKDDKQLCDVVYKLASAQLLINSAEADLQAKVEAAKKAFADATGPIAKEIAEGFAAVEIFATANKDRLFPIKGKARAKTFKVLAHRLQYRSSEQVKSPANAVNVIKAIIFNAEAEIMSLGECEHSTHLAGIIQQLESLIRQPEPELNKDAVKACSDKVVKDYLAAHGITVETLETFKLAFAFTPEQTAN